MSRVEKEIVTDEQARRKAEILTLVMGGDYNMGVEIGKPGGGSHWDFVKNKVTLDPVNLKPGVAVHEGNHRIASRVDYVMDLWPKTGFAYGFNAFEDPRVNEAGMHLYPGTREWIEDYIEEDLSEEGGLDYQSIQKDAENALGYVPKFVQYGAEAIRYWHEKEFTDHLNAPDGLEKFLEGIPDSDVKKKIADVIPALEDYYHTIPYSKDEMEVHRKAKESADIFRDRVWPDYQKLVEQSLDDQSMSNMLSDMLESDGKEGQKGQMIVIPFSALPKDIQDEIKQKIQEHMDKKRQEKEQEQNQQNQSGQQAQEDQQSQPGDQEGQDQAGDQSGDQQQQGSSSGSGQKQGFQKGQEKVQADQKKAESAGEESQSQQIPWNDLPDNTKKAVKEVFDTLPEERQQDYKDKARKDLEDVEDQANEKLRGKMTDPKNTQTHKEQQKQQEEDAEDAKDVKAAEKAFEQIRRGRERILQAIPENPYHEVLSSPEVAGLILRQDREYRRIFTPDESPNPRYSDHGININMKRAMRRKADPRQGNIFEIKGRPTARSHRFLNLADMSGSMSDKIGELFKVIVANTELDNKHGLEDAILGFTDTFPGPAYIKIYKDFDPKKLDKIGRDRIGQMLPEALRYGSGTPTVEATIAAYKMLKERMARYPMNHNYFITYTDGQPNNGPASLLRLIREIRKDKTVVTVGFGIGPGTEFVNQAYPMLHERIRREIARVLGKSFDEVGNSFSSAVEFAQAYVIIIGQMVEHPELFQ